MKKLILLALICASFTGFAQTYKTVTMALDTPTNVAVLRVGLQSYNLTNSFGLKANLNGGNNISGLNIFTNGLNRFGSINKGGRIQFARALDGNYSGLVGFDSDTESFNFKIFNSGGGSLLSFGTNGLERGRFENNGFFKINTLGLDTTSRFQMLGNANVNGNVYSNNYSNLLNKKWIAFGDSFSNDPASDYVGRVASNLGLILTTRAVSGQGINQQLAALKTSFTTDSTFLLAYDIVTLHIGVNDFANGSIPLGNINSPLDNGSYAGDLKKFIELCNRSNPKIKIFIITPPEANGAGVPYKGINPLGWSLSDLSVTISQVSNFYAIQCIDLYAISGINLKTIPTFLGDGLHPSFPIGTNYMGDIVSKAFLSNSNLGKNADYYSVTSGYIPRLGTGSKFVNSTIFQSGSNLGIGTTTPTTPFEVNGFSKFTDVGISGTTYLLTNGFGLDGRNAANSGYYHLIGTDASNRVRIASGGNESLFGGNISALGGLFTAATTASSASLNITSNDVSLRMKATGSVTTDKNTYEIRNVGVAANEYLQFRTINDAQTVFTNRMALWNSGSLYLGTSPVDNGQGSLTLTGRMHLTPATVSISSYRMPTGVAPTTPVTGDWWSLGLRTQTFDGTQTKDVLFDKTNAAFADGLVGVALIDGAGNIAKGVQADRTTANTQTKTASYTVVLSDFGANGILYVRADATSGNMTITLPTAAIMAGLTVTVKKIDATSNAVTISGSSIDGVTTKVLSGLNVFTSIVSNSTVFSIVGDKATGTGWASYSDGLYTPASPLSIATGTTVTLTNNAATSIKSQLPVGVTDFYNSATSKITPGSVGDGYGISIRFKAKSTSSSDFFDFGIDIGGTQGVIFKQTRTFIKGANTEVGFDISINAFSLATFIANGGLVKITAGNGTMSVYSIVYDIFRTHKSL